MYFIEFIIKKITQKKEKFSPEFEPEDKDYESCEHIFMPVDSTNEVLSCTKCGVLIRKNELENNNL